MLEESSQLGFDRDRSIANKLGRTLLLFVLGGFFLIFTGLAFAPGWNPWWQLAAKIVIEVCWSFWLLALIFVWWMPTWVRWLYLYAEGKMMRLAVLLKWVAPPLFFGAIALLWYLHHVGILPVQPR